MLMYKKNDFFIGKVITPEVSLTSPAGPFSCSISREMKLEKEHVLKIPLTFAPDKETVVSITKKLITEVVLYNA